MRKLLRETCKLTRRVISRCLQDFRIYRPTGANLLHGSSSRIQPNVTEFQFASNLTMIDLLIDRKPSSYAASHRCIKHNVIWLTSSFSKSSDIRVVVDNGRSTCQSFQPMFQTKTGPAV